MEVGHQGFIGPIREPYTSVVSDLMKKTSRDEARVVLIALEKISARSKDAGIIENCPRPWRTLLKSLRSGKAQDARSIISLIKKELGKKTEKKPTPSGVLGPQTKQAKKGNAPQPALPKGGVKQKQGARPIPSKIDEGLQERFEALRRRDRPTEEPSLSEIDKRLNERLEALRRRDRPIGVGKKEEQRSLSEIDEELENKFLQLSEKEFEAEMKRSEKEFLAEMKRIVGQIPQPLPPEAVVEQEEEERSDEGLQERFEELRRRDLPTEEPSLSEIDQRLDERLEALRHRDRPIDVEQKEGERSLSEVDEELENKFLRLSEKEFQAEMKRSEKEFQDEMNRVTDQISPAQTWNIKGWVVGGAVSLAVGSLAFFGLPMVGAAPMTTAGAGAAVFAASFLTAAATKIFSSSRKRR